LLGEIVHALPLFAAFSGKVDPVCRKENARFNKLRGDGPGSRNDASSRFLTVGKGLSQQVPDFLAFSATSPIRFECPMESKLPALLKEAGHRVIDFGTHERLVPIIETLKEHGGTNTITRQQVGVGVVGVWQFDLPFG